MVLELMIGGLNREGAEAKVTAYDEVQRAAVLREAADFIDSNDTCRCGGCDSCVLRKHAADLRAMADGSAT